MSAGGPPSPRRARAGWFLTVVAAAFMGGAAAGAAVSFVMSDDTPSADEATTQQLASVEDAVTEAVGRAIPSIVTIINQKEPYQDEQGRTVEGLAIGSGVIVDPAGFVLTNEHVIHDRGKLSVVLNNGEERPAKLVAHDAPFTDLSVLQIPGGDLKALPFGDSARLKLGQTIIAIGSALFEYRNSVTVGVVSGLGRRYLRENVMMEDLIQTDAAINSGNSGGPLITTSGQVVGLTTNVVRRIGTTENVYGIAFAISSRTMQPIVKSIIERGFYPRPYIGVDHLEIDSTVAQQQNLRVDHGALVQRVVDGSPAQSAGIRPGDIILRLGRLELSEDIPFINALARLSPNERAPVQLIRDGRLVDVTVQVGQR